MNAGKSRAQQFFDQIVSRPDPVKFLEDLVTNKQAEDSYLEFKGVGKIQDKDTKKYWSKALSGFANTEGGVVVWGIRAEKAPSVTDASNKIDTATDLDLADHPDTFAQKLKDVMLQATIDPVQGVQIRHLDKTPGGQGFVVCLIPEGGP